MSVIAIVTLLDIDGNVIHTEEVVTLKRNRPATRDVARQLPDVDKRSIIDGINWKKMNVVIEKVD